MKLSKETIEVLKNFAAINMSMLIRRGSVLKTVNSQKSIMAIANIQETMPREFALYDLNQFLGILSSFNDAELGFTDENDLQISDSTGAVAAYRYAAKESIVSAPDKNIELPTIDVTLNLEEKSLVSALRAASILCLPEICFVGRNGKTYLAAHNTKNDAAHSWEIPVGSAPTNYRTIFRMENLHLLPRDYTVTISTQGLANFKSKTGDVSYFVATENSRTKK